MLLINRRVFVALSTIMLYTGTVFGLGPCDAGGSSCCCNPPEDGTNSIKIC